MYSIQDFIIINYYYCYFYITKLYVLLTKPFYFSILLNIGFLIIISINLINFLYNIDSIFEHVVKMDNNDYSNGDPGPSTINNNNNNNDNNSNNNNNGNNNQNHDVTTAGTDTHNSSDTDSNDSEPEYTRHRRALGDRTLHPGESQNLGRFDVMHVRDRARVQTLNIICIECQEAVANIWGRAQSTFLWRHTHCGHVSNTSICHQCLFTDNNIPPAPLMRPGAPVPDISAPAFPSRTSSEYGDNSPREISSRSPSNSSSSDDNSNN